MLRDPRAVLARLCAGLGLALYPGYLDDCSAIVFPQGTFTRHKVEWTPALRGEVAARSASYAHLAGYAWDDDAAGGASMRTKLG